MKYKNINLTFEQIDLNRREEKKVLLVYLQSEFAIIIKFKSTHCEKTLFQFETYICSQHDVHIYLQYNYSLFFTDFFPSFFC